MHTRFDRVLAMLSLVFFAAPTWASGTAANTSIDNTASASYTDPSGTPQTATSNTVSVVVDELLNVTVADGGNVSVLTPDTDRALAFTVTNTGNGNEAFELVATNLGGDDFDATGVQIYLDDGDGVFNSGTDTLYSFNVNDPVLAADASRVVFIVGDIPAAQPNGDRADLSLRATAVTAGPTGNPAGTTFGGAGDGGTDAVAGLTTASQLDQASYLVSAVTTSLVKSQSVLDPFGGSSAVPGAVITYTLTFTLSGAGSITLGQITDPIPANATYVPNSITLNGVAQTDAADSPGVDNSRFTGTGIEVNLSSPLAAPSTQTVTFQVTIN
jgi:uncharacterized repeat protein (TIGR01451 family)